jgi:hypothetical protein
MKSTFDIVRFLQRKGLSAKIGILNSGTRCMSVMSFLSLPVQYGTLDDFAVNCVLDSSFLACIIILGFLG